MGFRSTASCEDPIVFGASSWRLWGDGISLSVFLSFLTDFF